MAVVSGTVEMTSASKVSSSESFSEPEDDEVAKTTGFALLTSTRYAVVSTPSLHFFECGLTSVQFTELLYHYVHHTVQSNSRKA